MTVEPRAFLAIDIGAATAGAALIGRVAGAWRLLGSVALPATADPDAAAALVLRRVEAADPRLSRTLGLDGDRVDVVPAVTVRSHPVRRLAVIAASERALAPLVRAGARSGWQVAAASAERTDPLAMSRLLLDVRTDAILVGAGDPPGPDERGALAEMTALMAAVAARRPDHLVILAGAMSEAIGTDAAIQQRSGETLLAPAAHDGPAGQPLRDLLTELARPADDARRAIGVAAASLADVLDRRVEVIETGFDGGLRAMATPGTAADGPRADVAIVPAAGIAPADPDDATVDRVLAWLTVASDRHRLRDRMRELRIAPWADATGDGTALRMAAVRAALGRLAEATRDLDQAPPPDLVLVAGGVWSVVTPGSVELAVADVFRRPGASAYALDHARLLGPLGSIPDEDERRAVIADLADDLLLPLGSVVTPAGLRSGRSAGSLVLHDPEARRPDRAPIDLVPGGLEVVALPAGATAVAEFRFRDGVRMGGRGRHFAIDVAGGLAGMLVDLRDVPLRLPERADLRREQLDAWQSAVTAGSRDG